MVVFAALARGVGGGREGGKERREDKKVDE